MIYLDTSFIVSYMDIKDANHKLATQIYQNITNERKVVSQLVLLEISTVYARSGLDKPLELGIYSIEKIGAELINVDMNEAIKEALMFSYLKLRTLDLLHLIIAKLIGADKFLTFDKDILSKSDLINSALNISIMGIH